MDTKFEYAFYFLKPNDRLSYGDGRLVKEGITHSVSVSPRCCFSGLHGSKKIVDALNYAQSNKVALCKISGSLDYGDDKLCGTLREYIKIFNIEDISSEFARKQALGVWPLVKDYISSSDYELVEKYLVTGDTSLRDAAWDAAWAARDAARAAAWDATRDAANKELLQMIEERFSYTFPSEVYNG